MNRDRRNAIRAGAALLTWGGVLAAALLWDRVA